VTFLEEVCLVIAGAKVCEGIQGNDDDEQIQTIAHLIRGETCYLFASLFSFNKIKNSSCSCLALPTVVVRWECSHNSWYFSDLLFPKKV